MEKRRVKQIEVYDKEGMLEYTIIPNYKIKEKFLTDAEFTFYKALKKVAYDLKLTIFSQVSLSQLICINNERKTFELFNRISSKSIDFVLYDEIKNKIICCIELDDETHNKSVRMKRDKFLDKALNNNIKLIHIKRQNYYDIEELKKVIMA